MRRIVRDDDGSTPVEFVLVGALLTALTLAVIQLGVALYVRNVVHDAAVEGAYYAALADTTLGEGVERARRIVATTVGEDVIDEVTVRESTALGGRTTEVTIVADLPLFGLLGVPRAMEVTGRAPMESFDG
ncbi:TadE/TadG family type IV pilus assembly protein [Microbacterium sp.]|uniref:TadE/TadG family type IV pilus assembly protein n=1 Tax=Microbacterium sp. TaxID=51671 RepID=UPI003A85C314